MAGISTLIEADAKVAVLIDESTKTWKEEMVKGILNEEEAALVCSLPISTSGLPDKQIWAHTKNGQFNVKSAYHLEVRRKNKDKGEVSKKNTEMWKLLWKLNVPGVVKMFLWKALNNCLPTKLNLCCRKIVKDYYCPVYNLSPVQKWVSNEREMHELWADWCTKLSREDLELMAVFKQAQQQGSNNKGVNTRRSLCRWEAPAEDQVKVNWDAAVKLTEGGMGIGVVMRDEKRDVLVSLCSQKKYVRDPLVVEMQALWRAMKLCAELNMTRVIFEGDALNVIRAVNNPDSSWEWHGQLVEDIKEVLKNRNSWKVIHSYRESNCVAHFLAKMSFNVNEERIWIKEGPEGIQPYVLKDKM
ncbi:uncharacterized protein LOC122276827 [Carya illinoinensis]|uniref:uncharacterized protein LOC122276827 n=1 Tax=Carya illinoinensis TaxID=32201 RepID=UPI001C71D634|nr:uncharacterized protein LOC122276827 [Carya illinoinensis]